MQHQDNPGLPRKSMRSAEHSLWYDSCLGAVSKGLFSFFLEYLSPVQGVMTPALSSALCHPGTGRDRHPQLYTLYCIFSPCFGGLPAVRAATGAALPAAHTGLRGPFLQPPSQPLPSPSCLRLSL